MRVFLLVLELHLPDAFLMPILSLNSVAKSSCWLAVELPTLVLAWFV